MKKIIILCCALLFLIPCVFAQQKTDFRQGVWVTVFSAQRVLYSKEAAIQLVDFCLQNRINQIYLQVFQSGNAYFDSPVSTRDKYEEILKVSGIDTIDFLLTLAHAKNIKVFAWVNVLSLGANKDAYIISKSGEDILTRDQYAKTSGPLPHEKDAFYLRDKHYFLEPGDPRVKNYYVVLISELLKRYPGFDGVHLDYVRYPMTVPFLPGSRFAEYGIDYGFAEKNLSRFREKENFDPRTPQKSPQRSFLWDNWKRRQVTELVEKISHFVKKYAPEKLVSCAVIPDAERAYTSLFQEWPLWLEKKIVDYVVLMDYTEDARLFKQNAQASLALRNGGNIYIGIGAFLLKENPLLFFEEYRSAYNLAPDGIVFFSYDELTLPLTKYLHEAE